MPEVDKVEQAAMHGQQMPGGLDVFEQIRFHGLSYIYGNYKAKLVDKATASAYKRSLVREIKAMRAEYAFGIKCYNTAADRYKATEAEKNVYRTNRTLENADKLVAALDGLEVVKDV